MLKVDLTEFLSGYNMVNRIKREFLFYGDEENCDRSRFYEGRLGFLYWTFYFRYPLNSKKKQAFG